MALPFMVNSSARVFPFKINTVKSGRLALKPHGLSGSHTGAICTEVLTHGNIAEAPPMQLRPLSVITPDTCLPYRRSYTFHDDKCRIQPEDAPKFCIRRGGVVCAHNTMHKQQRLWPELTIWCVIALTVHYLPNFGSVEAVY
jgi:hypothetical protein